MVKKPYFVVNKNACVRPSLYWTTDKEIIEQAFRYTGIPMSELSLEQAALEVFGKFGTYKVFNPRDYRTYDDFLSSVKSFACNGQNSIPENDTYIPTKYDFDAHTPKQYLGYINGWTETPEIVKNCKHIPVETQGRWHCDTHVECNFCGYSYDIDSSD